MSTYILCMEGYFWPKRFGKYPSFSSSPLVFCVWNIGQKHSGKGPFSLPVPYILFTEGRAEIFDASTSIQTTVNPFVGPISLATRTSRTQVGQGCILADDSMCGCNTSEGYYLDRSRMTRWVSISILPQRCSGARQDLAVRDADLDALEYASCSHDVCGCRPVFPVSGILSSLISFFGKCPSQALKVPQ
jgi:hypothetical protein